MSNAFQNAQKSFQNQPSIGSAFDKDKSQIDCTSWNGKLSTDYMPVVAYIRNRRMKLLI